MRTRLIALALLVSAVVTGVLIAGDRPTSYIYKRGDSLHTRISGRFAFDRIGPISKKYGNEFVWVRMNGGEYLIRDANTLAQVRQAFRHLDELEPELRAIERRLKPFEREFEEIEERVDTLGDSLDDDDLSESERDDIENKLRDAEEKMRAVEEKMRPVEREMERLDNESERREVIAEKQFEAIVERAVERGLAQRVD
jgi:septal ring factor EnvC (AmiA/AmiB activator)